MRALTPDAGSILLQANGQTHDLATLPQHELDRLRQRIQMVFQDPMSSLNPRKTISQILQAPLQILLGLDRSAREANRFLIPVARSQRLTHHPLQHGP